MLQDWLDQHGNGCESESVACVLLSHSFFRFLKAGNYYVCRLIKRNRTNVNTSTVVA